MLQCLMWRIPLWAAYGRQLQWIKTKNLKFKPFAGEKGCVISNSWDCSGCLCQSCCLKVASCWAPSGDTWFTWRKFGFLPIVSRSLNCNVTRDLKLFWFVTPKTFHLCACHVSAPTCQWLNGYHCWKPWCDWLADSLILMWSCGQVIAWMRCVN